jgi:hypothetical protein
MGKRLLTLTLFATMTAALAACGGATSSTTYDIGPIVYATNSCAKYGGVQSGSGIDATCTVDLSECQRALADYNKGFTDSGVQPLVDFHC